MIPKSFYTILAWYVQQVDLTLDSQIWVDHKNIYQIWKDIPANVWSSHKRVDTGFIRWREILFFSGNLVLMFYKYPHMFLVFSLNTIWLSNIALENNHF